MTKIKRRDFLKVGGFSLLSLPLSANQLKERKVYSKAKEPRVQFIKDGLGLTPDEYSELLLNLSKKYENIADYYSRGGIVEALEKKFASLLGKESAVFMPTGTLANHIAVRKLSGNRKKVIVQMESHIYNDSGDCAEDLSGLTLIPLAPKISTYTLEDVKRVLSRVKTQKVKSEVGVIMIESPVRRMDNRMFDYEEMKRISNFARENNIKLHLDGARLFNAVAHTGISPKEFASLFDTVYVSMYKNFNSAGGAILAGSKEFCEELYHTRRMFGGGIQQVWPFALVAYYYADKFLPSYKKALLQFKKFSKKLSKDRRFKIETYKDGTNVFILKVKISNIERFRENLEKNNIFLPPPKSNELFKLKINPTLNNLPTDEIVKRFKIAV